MRREIDAHTGALHATTLAPLHASRVRNPEWDDKVAMTTCGYLVVMTSPRSIRFDSSVSDRLRSYASRHPGVSSSSVAARLVDEGLRMEEHPGVLFRDGPMGRRATLVGGPDVWEVVRSLRSARTSEPELSEVELIDLVADNAGLPSRLVRTAVQYWAAYPAEVDALLEHAEHVGRERVEAAARERALLGA